MQPGNAFSMSPLATPSRIEGSGGAIDPWRGEATADPRRVAPLHVVITPSWIKIRRECASPDPAPPEVGEPSDDSDEDEPDEEEEEEEEAPP